MDYKEKYEEALERAKNYREGHTLDVNPKIAMEYIFPELKESEDEKIRKSIIEEFKIMAIGGYEEKFFRNGVRIKDAIAWLEKQSEKAKTIDIDVVKEKAHKIAWETSKHYDPLLSKESWCEMAALDMASWIEKQGVQKPN